MPKRISKKLTDTNEIATAVLAAITSGVSKAEDRIEQIEREAVSKVMVLMGRKGGKIGGKRRLKTVTAEARKQAASNAAKARWKNKAPKNR